MRKNITILIVFALVFSVTNKLFAQEVEWNKWVAPKSANDMRNPFKGDPSATALGKKMFRGMCVLCHGIKGDGKGGGGVSLDPKPANFLAISVSDQTDGALFWKLTEGKPPMASYKDLLSEDQRWKLISYIRTLEKNK